jgi:hypothetical protein
MTNPPPETAAWTPALATMAPTAWALKTGTYPGAPPGTYNPITGAFTSRAEENRLTDARIAREQAAEDQKQSIIEGMLVPYREAVRASQSFDPREKALGMKAVETMAPNLMNQLRMAGMVTPGGGMTGGSTPTGGVPGTRTTISPEGKITTAETTPTVQPGANEEVRMRPDGTFVIVDKVTGQSRPAAGVAGQPIKTAQPLTPEASAAIYAGVKPGQLPTREQTIKMNEYLAGRAGGITGARTAEQIRVQAAMTEELRKVTRARAAGREEGRLGPDVLMSPKALESFGLPFGSTWKDAFGMIASNPKARLAVEELKVSDNLLNSLGGYADKLITAPDWTTAATQGTTLWTGAFTRANADAAVFADQREALLGVFSRQIGAERGVLTDRDIYRIDKALPNFRDTKQVKDMKMKLLRSMIQVNREARTKSISTWLDSDVDLTTGTRPGGGPPSGPPPPGGGATKRYNPSTGRVEAIP